MEGSGCDVCGFSVLADCSCRLRDSVYPSLCWVTAIWASLCAKRLDKQDTCNLRVHSGNLLLDACCSQIGSKCCYGINVPSIADAGT